MVRRVLKCALSKVRCHLAFSMSLRVCVGDARLGAVSRRLLCVLYHDLLELGNMLPVPHSIMYSVGNAYPCEPLSMRF